MKLKIDIQKKEEGVFIINPLGAIDTSTYQEFEDKIFPLIEPSTKVLILDMSGVNYISSMGVSAIIKIKKAVEANKGSLLIANLQPQIKAVFEVIRALPNMTIFKSLDEADQYLDRIQRQEIDKLKK